MTDYSLSDGVLTLQLPEYGELELLCTPGAMGKISHRLNGVAHALQKINLLEWEAMCVIVRAGANLGDKDAQKIENALFKFGIVNLSSALTEYMIMLTNGGKMPDATADEVEKPKAGKPSARKRTT